MMKYLKVSPYEATTEKQVVVIDIGYTYTKIGFSGEVNPRYIVPSTFTNGDSGNICSLFNYTNKKELYDNLVTFLQYLYFQYLLISPKDRKVVIVESLLSPSDFRETLAKVLFCHMEVSSLMFISSHMVALYPLNIPTALCFDIGFQEAVLIPVYEGYPVLHAYQAEPLGGSAIEANIRTLLNDHYKETDTQKLQVIQSLPRNIIEDIKARLCFVKPMNAPTDKSPPSVQYPIQGEDSIVVDGEVRQSAGEVLFQLDGEEISIATMILNALLKCSVDMRKSLAENILLIGGTSVIPGIKSRLKQELDYLITTPKYKEKLFVKEFRFHSCDSKEHYLAWLGGAIIGGTNLVNSRSLSKEEYLEHKMIPDWANLAFNTRNSDATKGCYGL